MIDPMGWMWYFEDEPVLKRTVTKHKPDMIKWPDVKHEPLYTLEQAKEILKHG